MTTRLREAGCGVLGTDIRSSSVLVGAKDRNTISIREAYRRLIQLLLSAWTPLLSQVLGKIISEARAPRICDAARPYDDVERFHLAATRLLTGLVSKS